MCIRFLLSMFYQFSCFCYIALWAVTDAEHITSRAIHKRSHNIRGHLSAVDPIHEKTVDDHASKPREAKSESHRTVLDPHSPEYIQSVKNDGRWHRDTLIGVFFVLGILALAVLGARYVIRYFSQKNTKKQNAASSPGSNPDQEDSGSILWSSNGGLDSWKAVWMLIKMWLNDPQVKWRARSLTLLVVVHWLVREALWAFVLSANNAEVINSIADLHESKDTARVKRGLAIWMTWEIVVGLPVFFLLDPWVSQWFEISFKTFCTRNILDCYLDGGGQAFYRIKMKEGDNKIDNPDQRIGEDLSQIASQIYNILSSILSAAFGCSMWAAVFLSLGGPYLLLIAMVMATLRLAVAYGCFGKRLVNAFQGMLWTAADFRYSLMRVREHAEAVALSGGDKREKNRSEGYFEKHIDAIKENTWVAMAYSASMNLLSHFPHLMIWLYQIPLILNGTMHMGDAVRVLQGYDQVAKVLDFFSTQLVPITVLQANAERFNKLWKACKDENAMSRKEGSADVEQDDPPADDSDDRPAIQKIEFQSCDPHLGFALENVVVNAPGSNIQVGGVSISCERGKAVLVSGSSGLGKSSVLKSMAGLWPNGAGVVKLSKDAEVMLLPPTCYIPKGSLLEVAIYPRKVPTDELELGELANDVKAALSRAQLEAVVTRWGLFQEERDWNVIFSPGERQRIAFARLFLKLAEEEKNPVQGVKGLIAILDESTSAIDMATEAKLYNSIRAELAKGNLLAVVSVGHRATLPEYHETELQIGHLRAEHKHLSVINEGTWMMPDGDGTPWRFIELQKPGA